MNTFHANSLQFLTLEYFFNSILLKLNYISVFSIEKILSFLKTNVKLIKKNFDQNTLDNLFIHLIELWYSGMNVVIVSNSITKSIANNFIFLMRKFNYSIQKVKLFISKVNLN